MPGHFGTVETEDGCYSETQSSQHVGLFGNNTAADPPGGGGAGGAGVFGLTVSPGAAGVFGANNGTKGAGVQGNGPEAGVSGFSEHGTALRGHSNHNDGAQAFAHDTAHNGVLGLNDATGSAPTGGPPAGNGVYGYTTVSGASGVVGAVAGENAAGAGITGLGPVAGRFFGEVQVNGDITVTGDVMLTGADLAEEFEADTELTPGTVVCIADEHRVTPCTGAYDTAVAGVLSGAGGYRPGILLNRGSSSNPRMPVALGGRVFCLVDADRAPIKVGDLLTTSATEGHAMRADPARAAGSVLGKALRAVSAGRGQIPILVSLQ